MTHKYKLKVKTKHVLKIKSNILSKFKSSKSQKNFRLSELYNIEKLNTNFYEGKILDKFLRELLTNKIKPCSYTNTIKVIKCWNIIVGKNKKVSQVKVNLHSKMFNFIRLALTYRCWKSNKSISDVIIGINHLKYFVENSIDFKISKFKVRLLNTFLIPSSFDKNWFNICCTTTLDLARSAAINIDKYKYKKTLNDRIIPRFLSIFYPENKNIGMEEVNNNKHLFIRFTDSLVEDHKNRYLNDQTIGEYIKDYFHYLETKYTNYTGTVPLHYLFTKVTKFEFFRFMMVQTGNTKYGEWLGQSKDPIKEKKKQ